MEKRDEELILSLVDKDPELKKHYEEHIEFERQLDRLSKPHLTAEEEVERKRIQKLKLAGKDRIMEILYRHRSTDATAHH
jgi:uncharacterized protein